MESEITLGWFELCLKVGDIARSLAFYQKLGFRQTGGTIGEKCVIMQYGACRIALYQDYLENNLLNFRGGNVMEIAQQLEERGIAAKKPPSEDEEGNQSLLVQDPDGNELYFVQNPSDPTPL
jgi:lactoylglutathione lyase